MWRRRRRRIDAHLLHHHHHRHTGFNNMMGIFIIITETPARGRVIIKTPAVDE
jgi:hypothetical protein